MALGVLRQISLMALRPWLWITRPLSESNLDPDPIRQFDRWYKAARRSIWLEFPNGMTLSTIAPTGLPDGRMVLLKSYDRRGFVFYTNTLSSKGADLASRAAAALTFYWEPFQRQVRIRGETELVSNAEADAYFASRPRGSQIGAWASKQSQPLPGREILDNRVKELKAQFKGQKIPRPPHWTGYRVIPREIEFWQLRANRLHDRFLYTKTGDNSWEIRRLFP